MTDESLIIINSPYVEFEVHKSGGRGSENAFYVNAVLGQIAETTPVDSALVEAAIEVQVYGEHTSTLPIMVENMGASTLDFNNLNLSEGDRITLQVADNYQVQGVVEADGLDVLLTSLGDQLIDEGFF